MCCKMKTRPRNISLRRTQRTFQPTKQKNKHSEHHLHSRRKGKSENIKSQKKRFPQLNTKISTTIHMTCDVKQIFFFIIF